MNVRIILLLILALTSCISKNSKVEVIKEFPKELSPEVVEIKVAPVLYSVDNMAMLDSALMLIDMKSDTILRFFESSSLKYLAASTLRGRGPNEEQDIQPFINVLENDWFLYRNLTSIKIAKFDYAGLFVDIIREIKLPGELLNFQHTLMINDSLLIGWSLDQNSKYEFISYNLKTRKTNPFGPLYPNIADIPETQRTLIFSKAVTLKSDKTKFAAVYDKFQLLRIYLNTGELDKEVRFSDKLNFPKELVFGDISHVDLNKVYVHYQRIQSTNNFIYALYSGKSVASMSNSNSQPTNLCSEIHVWNWEGTPIAKIILKRGCYSFAVSADDSYIVCSDIESIDTLYRYNISFD